MKMSTVAIILLATFTASDCKRVRLEKAEGLLDATDARAFEHGAITAGDGLEAASSGAASAPLESRFSGETTLSLGPGLAHAIAVLDAAVDESDVCRALGDSALKASILKLDSLKVRLADMLGDSLATREKLYDAAGRGEVDVVKDLVKHGVNVNIKARVTLLRTEGTGTPLQHAAKEGYPESVRVLLQAGAEKDYADEDKRTPLWHAAHGTWRDSLGVMRVLLEAKANTATACTSGMTPLHMAASKDHEAAVRMLLDFGANVDGSGALSDKLGGKTRGSPLVDATGYGANPQIARILLEAGADPDLASFRGRSPLHNCAERNNADIARLLLEAGANKDATNEDGKTPLFVAAQAGSTEVVRILIKAGSRACLANNIGETPITVAKNEEIRKILEAAGDC